MTNEQNTDPNLPDEISWQRVTKAFRHRGGGTVTALENVSVSVRRGEFLAILGPSGCGKTTLLSTAAGLVRPSRGRVLYRGNEVRNVNTQVGYVTQRDTLLPWRDVRSNIGFGLEMRGVSKAKRAAAVRDAIRLVGLEGFEKHYTHQLSGGMLKRTLLARTLAYQPSVLLLDEPFAALDAQLRLALHTELLKLWTVTGVTVVLVTHDVDEALSLADRIVTLTPRPSTVASVYDVPLPRPRDLLSIRSDPGFVELSQTLWVSLAGITMRRAG